MRGVLALFRHVHEGLRGRGLLENAAVLLPVILESLVLIVWPILTMASQIAGDCRFVTFTLFYFAVVVEIDIETGARRKERTHAVQTTAIAFAKSLAILLLHPVGVVGLE